MMNPEEDDISMDEETATGCLVAILLGIALTVAMIVMTAIFAGWAVSR